MDGSTALHVEAGGDLRLAAPVWLDMVDATPEEIKWVEGSYDLQLPSPEHLRDIEASARFFEHDGDLHLRSDFLSGTESHSHSVAVAFVLSGETLISIHEEDLPIFRLLRMKLHAESGDIENCRDVLVDLYGMDVEFSADALEEVYADLGRVSQSVLGSTLSDKQASTALAEIAHAEHVNGRIRRNVMDTQRALSFLIRGKTTQCHPDRRSAPDTAGHRVARRPHRVPVRQDQLPDGCDHRLHQHQPEPHRAPVLGGVGGLAAAHADRLHLRHELPIHAGAGLAAWVIRSRCC